MVSDWHLVGPGFDEAAAPSLEGEDPSPFLFVPLLRRAEPWARAKGEIGLTCPKARPQQQDQPRGVFDRMALPAADTSTGTAPLECLRLGLASLKAFWDLMQVGQKLTLPGKPRGRNQEE